MKIILIIMCNINNVLMKWILLIIMIIMKIVLII